ncbi:MULTISPECIES: hypothetical protein [unclassified Devosia]|uniref:hypothetical protein n=1 Tax=unclassified Devosia TaxID=196773 RepID=UPI0008688E17|nr:MULTISPECIES: hypothetical protein [unclassified Devosia]MBN9363081.1 hypothetical protein [Devosia sp.]ODS80516.1 MAG: hypothetical protein ABS47_25925 [Devosia sp. SCN 66-27]OJX23420.1 MAG: hypothetical protein BGO83_00625 [Devosia sp. 66-14]
MITAWLAAWWRRRRLRLAMSQIAELSPEFRRDLGLGDATIDDLIAQEESGAFADARQAVFGPAKVTASGPPAPGAAT